MNKHSLCLVILGSFCALARAEPALNSALPPAIPFEGQQAAAAGPAVSPFPVPSATGRQDDLLAPNAGATGAPNAPDLRVVLAMGTVAVVKEADQSGKILRTTTLHDGARFLYQGHEAKVVIKDGSLRLLDGRRVLAYAQVNSIAEIPENPNLNNRTTAETALSAGQGVKELKGNQFGFASLQNSATGSQSGGAAATPR
ncbi:hypothetical protein [Cupriavidus sp. TMH.W2]|uniref:hypothetical protein n=1 Tax=Cupriavidus sp. TMH.W2 TaxID=3434465 RepID=UPI003D76E516